MGDRFVLSVYNHSSHEITFEITNNSCMYLPNNRKINVFPYNWGQFDTLETSNNILRGCAWDSSKFNISAAIGSKKVGNTTYKVFAPIVKFIYETLGDFKNSMYVSEKSSSFSRPEISRLAFERIDSYGDFFFNGRGYYFDDSIKSLFTCKPIGSDSGQKEIDDLPPTALVNSNKQFISNIDDSALSNIIPRWINLGMNVYDVYSFAREREGGEKPRTSELAAIWKQFKDNIQGYYGAYQSVIANSPETTVHWYKSGDRPFFNIVFTDSLNNAEDIMIGNFYLPPPPTNDSNFYRNILHVSKEAHQALLEKVKG